MSIIPLTARKSLMRVCACVCDGWLCVLFLPPQDTDAYTCTVEELDLRGNSIGEVGCRTLCKAMTTNVSVRVLNLNNNPISNEGGMAVAEMLYVRVCDTPVDNAERMCHVPPHRLSHILRPCLVLVGSVRGRGAVSCRAVMATEQRCPANAGHWKL